MAAGTPAAAGASPQFYQAAPTAAYFDAASPKRTGEEQVNVPTIMEIPQIPHHPSAAAVAIKPNQNGVQVKLVGLA